MEVVAGIVAAATPLVYATIGETISEKAGVVNLSLDGSIMLSAMTGFAAAYVTDSVIDQAKAFMAKALTEGIKYELIVQNTSDPRALSDFRRKLQRKVRDVRTVSQTSEETKYNVFLIGTVEDLVDAVYDVAETIPGLEGMYQVLLRGKSVTFSTGL